MYLGFDPSGREHLTGPDHPESPDRLQAVARALQPYRDSPTVTWLPPRQASLQELALAHTPAYLEKVQQEVARGLSQLSTGDTAISPASWQVATRATGLVLAAVDAICSPSTHAPLTRQPDRRHKVAFCGNRPPGHHATANRGMGFCLINHVAVAARYARQKHGLDRVLIVDWDVHHGNGTQEIFYRDGHVLFCSTHQFPWYPGTGLPSEKGEGPGEGRILNFPFPAGAGREEIAGVFENELRRAARAFRPQLILVSAGFDSRQGDPLGRFQLTDADFAHLTKLLGDLAAETADGRLLSILEGGYNLAGLESALKSHLRALHGKPTFQQ